MTTNEKFFFGNKITFAHLRETILPPIFGGLFVRRVQTAAAAHLVGGVLPQGRSRIRVAMCLEGVRTRASGWRIEIVATDLSVEVLDKSRAGKENLQPVRSAARIADQMLGNIQADRRTVGSFNGRYSAHGCQHRQLNLLHDFSCIANSK